MAEIGGLTDEQLHYFAVMRERCEEMLRIFDEALWSRETALLACGDEEC